jgi:hypothetical protein
MHDDVHVGVTPSPSGGLMRLQTKAGDLGSWLGPTWAMLCGAAASNAFSWQGGDWLRLALLTLLVDAGWGNLWSALSRANWAAAVRRWQNWEKNRPTMRLPYTLPGTPGDRISRWMGKLQAWGREAFWPACGPAVRATLAGVPLTALVATLLGPELLLLSVAAVALMQLGIIWEGGRGIVPPGWDALVGVALPWLAGHAAFAPVTLPSASLALLFALAWGCAWNTRAVLAQVALVASQLVSAAYFVALQRPLAAGAILFLSAPQTALLPWVRADLPVTRFVRYTRPWLMAAMAIAAMVL